MVELKSKLDDLNSHDLSTMSYFESASVVGKSDYLWARETLYQSQGQDQWERIR